MSAEHVTKNIKMNGKTVVNLLIPKHLNKFTHINLQDGETEDDLPEDRLITYAMNKTGPLILATYFDHDDDI
jgi:hypothetical protein